MTHIEQLIKDMCPYGVEFKKLGEVLDYEQPTKYIVETEDYSDFEIVMRPTFDFNAHLMSRGIMLKVIEPQWLADEIYEMHLQAAEMYEEQ